MEEIIKNDCDCECVRRRSKTNDLFFKDIPIIKGRMWKRTKTHTCPSCFKKTSEAEGLLCNYCYSKGKIVRLKIMEDII